MSFSSCVRTHNDVAVIDFVGRIVLGPNVGEVRTVVRDLLGAGQRKLVLNMELVDYIDSCGLGELVSAYASVQSSGGEIRLASLQKRTSQLLQITKLHTVFRCFPDEISAVNSFTS